MELDEWELSAEELDCLEKDALNQIANRKNSSSSSSTSATTAVNKIDAYSTPPPSFRTGDILTTDDYSKKQQQQQQQHRKLSVKIFLHSSGDVAAKFPYDPLLVAAFRKIPKATWNAKERLWMFPTSSFSTAEKVLSDISDSKVEVENLDPLVRRAIAAASAVPDLRGAAAQDPIYPFSGNKVLLLLLRILYIT